MPSKKLCLAKTGDGADGPGDVAGLARLLDAEPRLLRERIVEPECYREAGRPQYFRDPKLFWFIANNPTLMKRMPANIVEVAEARCAIRTAGAELAMPGML